MDDFFFFPISNSSVEMLFPKRAAGAGSRVSSFQGKSDPAAVRKKVPELHDFIEKRGDVVATDV